MVGKMRGSITVLLALILVPVLALSNVLLEIGRYRSAKALLDEAVISSAMSLLGHFDEDLYTRFALFAMDQDEVDVSLFTEYLLGNSNDGQNNLSQMYGNVKTDFSLMYNLGNPYVLKNQIMQAEEYRGIISIMKDREPLEAMEKLITSEIDKNTLLELEQFQSTMEFSQALGEFGESLADMGDKAKALEAQMKKVQSAEQNFAETAADYDSSSDEEDENESTTAEEVLEARDTYCDELEALLRAIDGYIEQNGKMTGSINKCGDKLAEMIGKHQGSVNDEGKVTGGEAAAAVSKNFQQFQSKYEDYPLAKNGIQQLEKTEVDIVRIQNLLKNRSADGLAALAESKYVVTVKGNIPYGDWKDLLVTAMGDSIRSSILETIGQVIWVLSYVAPGTDRNNYQFNNQLNPETYANCFERNPSVDTGISLDDEVYMKQILKQTREAADQLHYDLSLLAPSPRVSNLPVMDEMDRLVNGIVTNMMTIVEFTSTVLQVLETTSFNDIFMLSYNFIKLGAKLIEALLAATALIGELIILVQNLETFLPYMKQALAEGFYINTYAVSMFPNRSNAITGQSATGTGYGTCYTPTMTELEASTISLGMSTGFGKIADGLLNTWGVNTPTTPVQSDMFAGACAEYIICGSQSEYTNQVKVYDRMFYLRCLANLPAFFTNETTLAALEVPFVGPLLFLVWYIAECNLDMKFLTMSEQKLPLIKTGDKIFLSPSGLKQIAKNLEDINPASVLSPKAIFNQIITPVKSATDTGEAIDTVLGFNYTDYCWLLMCMVSNQTKVNRIGDLIEMEMKQKKGDFSLMTANTCVRVEVDASYHMLLPAMMSTQQQLDGLDLHTLRFVGY